VPALGDLALNELTSEHPIACDTNSPSGPRSRDRSPLTPDVAEIMAG
jgi:hypothetical protein